MTIGWKNVIAFFLVLSVLVMMLLPFVKDTQEVQAYTAGEASSLNPSDIRTSRQRYIDAARVMIDHAKSAYGYGNSVLLGSNYPPLAGQATFDCVRLVTHIVYAATSSSINGNNATVNRVITENHTFASSTGLVHTSTYTGGLVSELRGLSNLYTEYGSNFDPGNLKRGDIVFTGDRDSSGTNHVIIALGPLSRAEYDSIRKPAFIPYAENIIYLATTGSTNFGRLESHLRLNKPDYNDDPDKGPFIKHVFRPKYDVPLQEYGGFRIKKTDSITGAGLTGAEFDLRNSANVLRMHVVMASGEYTSTMEILPGIYTLIETKAPTGYSLDPTPRTIEITANTINSVYWDNPIRNVPAEGSVRIVKKDRDTGEPLPGTVFDISQSSTFPSGSTVRVTTRVDGSTNEEVFNMVNGESVYVREVSVPAPYVLDNAVKQVTLTPGGLVSVEFTNKKAEGRIRIIKLDEVNEKPIAGAVFEVKNNEGEVLATITTDEDGIAVTPTLPLGQYQVIEITPAPGYVLSESVITLDLNFKDQDTPVIEVEATVKNMPIRGRIRIIKLASDTASPIKDVSFELLDMAGNPALDLFGNEVPELVTDGDGFAVTPWLRVGRYIVREKDAPNEYYIVEDEFEVEIVSNDKTENLYVRDDRVLLKVRIKKADAESGKPLANAVFELYDESGTLITFEKYVDGQIVIYDRLITNADGIAYLEGFLPYGRYCLKEITPPPGYITGEDVWFDITRDTTYIELDLLGKVFDLDVANNPTVVEVSKKGITGDDELPGAKLQVIDKGNGKVVSEWISTDQPYLIKNLVVGKTYILRENIAPDGYSVSSDVEFIVKDTGEIQQVAMYNKLTKIEILKIDNLQGLALQGVEFEIRSANGDLQHFVYDEKVKAYIWEGFTKEDVSSILHTNKEGMIVIYGLPIGDYTIKETKELPGYQNPTQPLAFTVLANSDDATPLMLEIINEPTELIIQKEDEATGRVLEGAIFQLYRILDDDTSELMHFRKEGKYYIADANGTITTLVSDDAGIIHMLMLPLGEYQLVEIEAPKGFELDPTPRNVTLSEEYGQVSQLIKNKSVPVPPTGQKLPLYAVAFWGLSAMLLGFALFIRKRKQNQTNV